MHEIARIEAGEDPEPPAKEPTAADLAERYLRDHVSVRCKPRTAVAYRWLVGKFVLPELGGMEIAAVERQHIAALYHRHRETLYQANRILEVVRKMFNLADAWGLRPDGANPCRFVQKYKERKRERFLTEEECRRLGQVLNEVGADGSETVSAVAAIRLLMLTGCRLSEIQTLRWEDVVILADSDQDAEALIAGFHAMEDKGLGRQSRGLSSQLPIGRSIQRRFGHLQRNISCDANPHGYRRVWQAGPHCVRYAGRSRRSCAGQQPDPDLAAPARTAVILGRQIPIIYQCYKNSSYGGNLACLRHHVPCVIPELMQRCNRNS